MPTLTSNVPQTLERTTELLHFLSTVPVSTDHPFFIKVPEPRYREVLVEQLFRWPRMRIVLWTEKDRERMERLPSEVRMKAYWWEIAE
jgi:hypothetical protein